MKRFVLITSLLAITCTLTACGSDASNGGANRVDSESAEYTINEETGETSMTIDRPGGAVSMRSGADVPVDLPAGLSIMPDTKVTGNTVVDQAKGKGVIVTFSSSKPPKDVIAYYRSQAEGAGVKIEIELDTPASRMIAGEGPGDLTFSMSVSPDDAGSTGQLAIGQGENY